MSDDLMNDPDGGGRRFLLGVGAFALLAGALMAARPGLLAASARSAPTPLALLATRELGLALCAVGALLATIARSAGPALRREAVLVIGALSALLCVNHVVRVATEGDVLFEPAHSHGEIGALLLLSIACAVVAARIRGINAS